MKPAKRTVRIPKTRCEFLLPTALDDRLERIRIQAGATRTDLLVAAVERFVHGEERVDDVETIHERLALISVAIGRLQDEMLEIRAYLDALGQKLCRGDESQFAEFLDAVETARSELGGAECQ
jgi:hypothetical protein